MGSVRRVTNRFSILFERTEDSANKEAIETPVFFVDLNLDQVVNAITRGREEYDLKPFFYTSLNDINAIKYRQEIFRDLENKALLENIKSFAKKMRLLRQHHALISKLDYKFHKEGWILEAAAIYCDAVLCLAYDLSLADLKSRGFSAFREYLTGYVNSERFAALLAETEKIKVDLSAIQYCLLIKESAITVRKYESEIDYSADVEKTFEKFKQGATKDYRVDFPETPGMNHIEARILEFVARLYPNIFSDLDNYCARNADYLDATIVAFDREIQFYISYLEFIEKLKQAGLKFCYPQITTKDKEVYNYEGFDLALAYKLITENSPIVCNDFYLKGRERIIVISGPNQGGKTTFARTFGQLHYLACLGCPIPGREARLFLFDKLFTHFEREETIDNLRGKLQDDLIRIHEILGQATSNSIIIMNEIFTSTTLQDAVFLSKKVMEKIIELDLIGVWVTFIEELASFAEQTVSMVSTVVPGNPAARTFKIIRKPADGLSYAISIAEKYRLTYEHLKERIKA
jgi:DNA mismatch repair protein MutS